MGYNKIKKKGCKKSMSVLKLNKDNFNEVYQSEKTVLIDFYADWCGPCKMLSPIIEEIADEYPQFTIAKVNVDEEPDLAAEFSVFSIPTLVVIKNGEVKEIVAGARPKEDILELLED